MLAEILATHDYARFAAALLVGLGGCHVACQILPGGGAAHVRWRLPRVALAGLVVGLVAWVVFLISLDGFFPYLNAHVPPLSAAISLLLCVGAAVGSIAVTAYGAGGARNLLLAGSLLSSGASCALFVSMSGVAAPMVLGYDLSEVLAVMLGGTVLCGLGLRGLMRAPTPTRRLLPATLMGAALPLLNVGSLAAILPFSEWETATATPNALALQPITVVFFSEFVAMLLLVRAGVAVDRQQAMRTEQENERLRQLTESTFEGILVHRDGVVLDANSTLCRMVGLKLEELKGRRLADFDGLRLLAVDGRAQPVEFDLQDASGTVIPVETLSRIISYGDGVAQVAAVRDIRERRAAEQSKRDRQRVVDLQREAEDLRERARIAGEANRAKSTFLAMMSHEIRTPMNAVLGLTAVLLDDDLADEQRRVISAIRESGEGLLRILNDILDYSKLDAGRLTFESLPFSPATLTQETVSVHGPAAMAKGLSISAGTDADMPPTLMGDPGRIRQVLMNLVSNAVKFTDAGAVIIRAHCLGRKDGMVSVMWEVRDTGIGIPKEKLGRLFDEFAQADNSITRRFGGTGLGLSISRRIVEQMGGQIEVESQVGLGSVFRFRLTLQEATESAIVPQPQQDCAKLLRATLRRLGRPARLLLAEDNATNQFVMVQLLRNFDVTVDVAGDGQAALAAVSAKAYDAVFMDMRMPKMDGLQATRAIRRLGGAAATMPIIALTANAFADDVKACLSAGMTHFVAKPVARDLLFQALAGALSGADKVAMPVRPAAVSEEPAAEPAAIDADALGVLIDALGRDKVLRMVEIFCAETQARLARLQGGTLDAADLRDEMHALKGTAATVGAPRLSRLAAKAEAGLQHGLGDDVAKLPDMSAAFDAYTRGLAQFNLAPALAA
jgi:PAS domain S-box-containing protein